MPVPVVKAVTCTLVHAPDLVQYGAEPYYKLRAKGIDSEAVLRPGLRSYAEALNYPPNQAFIGNIRPESLATLAQPWYEHLLEGSSGEGRYGELMPQEQFYGFLKIADDFSMVVLESSYLDELLQHLPGHPLFTEGDAKRLGKGATSADLLIKVENEQALPLYVGARLVGCIQKAHPVDPALTAHALLENLACKATGLLALRRVLQQNGVGADSVEYIMSCSEEAVGDRFNRGGGNLAKSMGELAGCINATGVDVKSFCSAPIHSMIMAGSLINSGVFQDIVIVGGGSLPKLGMNYDRHLEAGIPILEDVMGAIAFVVGPDDGNSPVIRLDAVGRHDIRAGFSQQAIMEALVVRPLERLGLKITSVDKYASELQNPDITRRFERGDTAKTNYKMIGALAAKRGEIPADALDSFVQTCGMPGYAPSQGHIPVGIAYLGHGRDALRSGEVRRIMFLAKGSLFLGRMTHMSDGMSVILESHP